MEANVGEYCKKCFYKSWLDEPLLFSWLIEKYWLTKDKHVSGFIIMVDERTL